MLSKFCSWRVRKQIVGSLHQCYLLLTTLALTLLTQFIFFLLWRRMFQRLQVLHTSVQRWAAGEYNHRSQLHGSDTLGQLGAALDTLMDRMQYTIAQLETRLAAQQQIEASLQASEERFRRLFEDAPIGLATADLDQGLTLFNHAFCTLLDYTPAELLTLSVQDFTHPEDFAREEQLAKRLIAGEIPNYQIEKRYITKHGKIVWVKVTGTIVRDRPGSRGTRFAIVEDITEHRRAIEALRASEAQLRLIIANLPVALAMLDANGTYLMLEGKILSHLELQHNKLLGKSVFAQFRHNPEVLAHIRRALAGETVTWVTSFEQHDFEVYLLPLLDEQQRVQSVIGMMLDITERNRAEAERLMLERRMFETQKLESLGVLANGIAHDFNNLLAVILGNAELALLDLDPDSPLRSTIQIIARTSQHAAALTRQLLDYSGKGQLLIERLNFNDVIKDMTALLHTSIGKGVHLQLRFGGDLPDINADATQLRQVLMNLVINAAEAIHDGTGTITITTKLIQLVVPSTETWLGADLHSGSFVMLEVADTGCGIDEATINKIFDPFFTTKFTGRGLGLAAVLGIVRGHGGALKVQSKPNHGTLFTVLLPCAEPVPYPDKEAPHLPSPGQITGTILVIDDEEEVLATVVEMLQRMGLRVFCASNSQSGIALFQAYAHTLDAILIDLTMPQFNGEHIAHIIRQIRPELPIMLMSGYSQELAPRCCTNLQATGFLQKPFTPTELWLKWQHIVAPKHYP